MKRRKGKIKKPAERLNSMRFEIERLESRQLLASFASVPIPGLEFVDVVPIAQESTSINVQLLNTSASGSTRALSIGNGYELTNVGYVDNNHFTEPTDYTEPTTLEPTTREPATSEPLSTTSEPLAYETPTVTQPLVLPEPITTIVGPVAETTITERLPLEPEKGIYFGPVQPSDQPITANLTAVSPRSGSLAQTQLFALISPADLPVQTFSETGEAVVANVVPNSPEPTQNLDAAFESFDSSDAHESDLADDDSGFAITELESEALEQAESDPVFVATAITEPSPFIGLQYDQISSPTLNLSVFPTLPLNVFGTDLPAPITDGNEETPQDQTPINPDLPAGKVEKADTDEKLIRGVQLFETAVLMIGLPNSRLSRHEDDTEIRPSG